MREHPGEVAHGPLDAAVVIAACTGALDLRLHEGEDVRAERDHRRSHALLRAHDVEGVGGFAHDAARRIRRLQLFQRCMQPDGLQIQQGDALDRIDGRVDVARHPEVDHELLGGGGIRAHRAPPGRDRHGAGARREVLRAEHGSAAVVQVISSVAVAASRA